MDNREKIFSSSVSPMARLVYLWLLDVDRSDVTNGEIGDAVGRSVVHVSNTLRELSDAGFIRMSGEKRGRRIEIV